MDVTYIQINGAQGDMVSSVRQLLSNGVVKADDIRFAEVCTKNEYPLTIQAKGKVIQIKNFQSDFQKCREVMALTGFKDIPDSILEKMTFKNVDMTLFK